MTLLTVMALALTGSADCGPVVTCDEDGDGVVIGMLKNEVEELADKRPPKSAPPAPGKPPTLYYEYVVQPTCPGIRPGPDEHGADCNLSRHGCDGYLGDGPLVTISERILRTQDDEVVQGWSFVGKTCYPEAVPGRSGEVADKRIAKAFKVTPFALPVPTWDPPRTDPLVNKPVYFTTTFAKAGYEPNETRTIPPSQMLGHDLKILPELKNVTYHFGDGDQHGPTVDTGGEYPDGTVTHTYTRAGTVHPRITATYTGRYSLDGGPWRPLGLEVTVKGEPTTLTPTTLVTELVPNP